MKRVLTALFMIVLAASLFVACGPAKAKGAELILNNGTEPQSLDPSKMSGVPEARIGQAIFEGLVEYDPKTNLALPGVAESWTTSADGKTIIFKLRKCQWSDGTPITAQTVVDSWLRMLDPATGAEYAFMITTVVKGAAEFNTGKGPKEGVGVKAVDAKTLQVDLMAPTAYAVDMMAHHSYAILPMHTIAKFGDDWTKVENIVSNGPFMLSEWKPQESLSVIPNPKYWDAKVVKLSKITFLPIEDQLTAYNKYKAGEIDWITDVPLDLIDEIKLRPDYQLAPRLSTYYYIFNMTRKPFDNVLVRKALAMSIDKQQLVDKVTKGGQVPTNNMVPAMAGYTPPKGNGLNIEEAKKLLAEAGYPNGKGFPKVTLLYNTSDSHKKIAEYAQEQWKQNLGIEVVLMNQEWATFLDTRQVSHDFEFTRAGWNGDYIDPNTFLDMFLSDSGLNDGLYKNPAYDELIRKAASMPAGAERLAVLAQAEDIMITQDQHLIPFYNNVNQDCIDLTKWGGWYSTILSNHNWKFIYKK